ncbi:MAG: hypothetical protein IJS44_01125 [Clostridia bacterium]|nr:hypothetical protein [Clostridia bacterium]
MQTSFYENRPFLEHEYEAPHFDESTGFSPEKIEADMREFIAQNRGLSRPLLVAHTMRILLEEVQIELNPHSIFPEKFNVGVDYSVDASHTIFGKLARERYHRLFPRLAPRAWEMRRRLALSGAAVPDTDFWHTLPDWNNLLSLGFSGILDRALAEKKKKEDEDILTDEARDFYDAVIITYRAVLAYVDRLCTYARAHGMGEFAARLAPLLHEPLKTLWQALEISMLYLNIEELGIERGRTFGLFDRQLYPFYQADLAAGRITVEEAKEYFRYFFQKIAAAKRYADQPIGICGTYKDGSDATNELTDLMLDVYRELDIHNPKIHVRYHKNIPEKTLRTLLDMIRAGNSSIVLINDDTVFAAYKKIGIPHGLAANYCPIGCYEPVIMGKEDARICASWINFEKAVEYAVTGGRDLMTGEVLTMESPTDLATFDDFKAAMFSHLGALIDLTLETVLAEEPWQYKINPSPILSATYDSCMERGRDIYNHGMEIQNTSVKCFAVGSAVDSIFAIKKLVYDDRRLTLSALADILRANWAGQEQLRLEVRTFQNKWGNNIREVDDMARELYAFAANKIVGRPNASGGVFRLGADSVAMAESYGKKTGASADGRRAGEPLSKNMRPVNGMERCGVTALIHSVTSLDHTDFLDAAPLDFLVHPSAVAGENGLCAMLAMVRTYFEKGGFAIQGNVVSAATLIDAQKNPEKYQNLQVRVCGWNEYFVNMKRELQDDFIARAGGIESV